MYEFFVRREQISEGQIVITGKDLRHMKDVLRMKIGEDFAVSDGGGDLQYQCRLKAYTEEGAVAEILYVSDEKAELPCRIVLYQGLPKSDKMETVIQKAVELGASEVVPVVTARSIVKLDDKKAGAKVTRWQAISEAAAKQSKRRKIPEIGQVLTYREALKEAGELDVLLIPYEMAEDMSHTRAVLESEVRSGRSIGIFIGPEGGFTPEEVQEACKAGAHAITLGKRILRTETAGMTVLSWLLYLLEDRQS